MYRLVFTVESILVPAQACGYSEDYTNYRSVNPEINVIINWSLLNKLLWNSLNILSLAFFCLTLIGRQKGKGEQ